MKLKKWNALEKSQTNIGNNGSTRKIHILQEHGIFHTNNAACLSH